MLYATLPAIYTARDWIISYYYIPSYQTIPLHTRPIPYTSTIPIPIPIPYRTVPYPTLPYPTVPIPILLDSAAALPSSLVLLCQNIPPLSTTLLSISPVFALAPASTSQWVTALARRCKNSASHVSLGAGSRAESTAAAAGCTRNDGTEASTTYLTICLFLFLFLFTSALRPACLAAGWLASLSSVRPVRSFVFVTCGALTLFFLSLLPHSFCHSLLESCHPPLHLLHAGFSRSRRPDWILLLSFRPNPGNSVASLNAR